MGLKTPLYEVHVAEGAKIVDFGGWDMPLHYGSQIEEHHAVRRDAGMFDVSHMGVIDVEGPRAREFLRHLLANDVAKLPPGKGLYSVLLREDGKILDDLIVFFVAPERFRLVVNAGTRDKDLSWMRARAAAFGITVTERRDLAMIAIQGPNARAKSVRLFSAPDAAAVLGLGPFESATLGGWFVSRTGYTGEDGFEIALAAADAPRIWQALHAVGIAAAGLGARDTLRLEAGMNLYGSDMDETHDPLESGLGWTVAFEPHDRDFIGRRALAAARPAGDRELVGLLLEERGVLRSHQPVITVKGPGEVTSGTFSPTLNRSIALARVPRECGASVQVQIRGKALAARVVKPPFVRHGRPLIGLVEGSSP
jgi:aminomethyltransferase